MATVKTIRNSFVAGEITPSLWGRVDQPLWQHGAARLENFVPRRTGGVRKRSGTRLVRCVAAAESAGGWEWRAFPFGHDRDAYGVLALRRAAGDTAVKGEFMRLAADGSRYDGGSDLAAADVPADVPAAVFSLAASERLADLRCLQIGDTLFFSFPGHRAFKCTVAFAAGTVEWTPLAPTSKPALPPALSVAVSGFHAEDDAYKAATRTYRLWAVKGGVLSDPRTATAGITLAWISGATVSLAFAPDWTAADYYVLAKLYGGQYGELTRFYPDAAAASPADASYWTVGSRTATYDGATYTAPLDTVDGQSIAAWRQNAAGAAANSTFASLVAFHAVSFERVPLLGIDLYVGADCVDENGETAAVGHPGSFDARLYSLDGALIASWTLGGAYSAAAHSLAIADPYVSATQPGHYRLRFYKSGTDEEVLVPLRGLVPRADAKTCSFVDDNINPGSLYGQQDEVKTGDSGMDVNLVSCWQQRLVLCGSASLPFTFWFSGVGDLYNFTAYRPQVADDAFEMTIAAPRATVVRHIVAEKWLLALTDTGEYMIDSGNAAFAYNTVGVRKISGVGCHKSIPPVTTESDVVFVSSDARGVVKMDYTLEKDSVVPTVLSVRAAHLTETAAIKAVAYQEYPDSVLWFLLADGTLASLTYFPAEEVCAWARHTLCGGGGLVAEDVLSVDAIHGGDGLDSASVVVLVLRDPARPGVLWLEQMLPQAVVDEPTGAAAQCIDHQGYDAARGAVLPSGGAPAAPVVAELETLRLDPEGYNGLGEIASFPELSLRVRHSGALQVRPVADAPAPGLAAPEAAWRATAVQPRLAPGGTSAAPVLFSGDAVIAPAVVQGKTGRVQVKSADALPCEILSLTARQTLGVMKHGG